MNYWAGVSEDLQAKILGLVNPWDIVNVAPVNKKMNRMVKKYRIWKRTFVRFVSGLSSVSEKNVNEYWNEAAATGMRRDNLHAHAFMFAHSREPRFLVNGFATKDMLIVCTQTNKPNCMCSECSGLMVFITDISESYLKRHKHYRRLNSLCEEKVGADRSVSVRLHKSVLFIYTLLVLGYKRADPKDVMCRLNVERCEYCNEPGASVSCNQCKEAMYCDQTCLGNDWRTSHENKCPLEITNKRQKLSPGCKELLNDVNSLLLKLKETSPPATFHDKK